MLAGQSEQPRAPEPRGPLSRAVLDSLREAPGSSAPFVPATVRDQVADADPFDEDEQLALFSLYELHYRGFAGVADRWEWEPELLRFRGWLESRLEAALRRRVEIPTGVDAGNLPDTLFAMADAAGGPSLSRHIGGRSTLSQVREFLVTRSIYQLKEADPHTWAIPRLQGRAKAALVEIQADEYGNGSLARMHSELFAAAMTAIGLDPAYGAYVDHVPGAALTAVNTVSMFGLHRRLRGAAVGHLTALEMTSSVAMRRYARGLRRLGLGDDVQAYFREHIAADAVHEQIAAYNLAAPLALDEPDQLEQILFGAAACHLSDRLVADALLEPWQRGDSALRRILTDAA